MFIKINGESVNTRHIVKYACKGINVKYGIIDGSIIHEAHATDLKANNRVKKLDKILIKENNQ